MKLIIDITEEDYDTLINHNNDKLPAVIARNNLWEALKHGTPLPKGHGRLIDEDEVIKAIEDRVEFLKKNDAIFMRLRKDIDILGCIPKIRREVPTIIEADKEEGE